MQEFTAPVATSYKIQCWGAQGGPGMGNSKINQTGGKGGYTKGDIIFEEFKQIYVYIGSMGSNPKLNESSRTYEKTIGGWNGGGAGDYDHADDESGGAGGGATDIRLINGNWDNFNSLKSRIMVAGAGGGGGGFGDQPGGLGGGLAGISSSFMEKHGVIVTPGSQTSGYKFGIGEDGTHRFPNQNAGGGGSGYYGGCEYKGERLLIYDGSKYLDDYGGAGGSSFISGYLGCDAIDESSTETNIIHTGQPNHYSGYVFINPVMIDGGSLMPKPKGGTETGHSGSGYCIISWISPSL